MLGALQEGGGERGDEERSLRFPLRPPQSIQPTRALQSLEQQSLSFNAPNHLGAMGEEIVRHRKEYSLQELRGFGKPDEWPQ